MATSGACSWQPTQPEVIGATVLAWAGFVVHNTADLPGQTIVSPESLLPTMLTFTLLTLWLMPATRRTGAWLLLAWTALNLVGGLLSVLPLPILPFTPAQTPTHYAFHGLYAVAQIPLVCVCIWWLRTDRRVPPRKAGHRPAHRQ